VLNNLVGVKDVAAAATPAAAAPPPPRNRPTTFETNDNDGADILAHIFMRIPMLLFLVVDMAVVDHPDDRLLLLVIDGRSNNEDVDEQGTPIFVIDVICFCWWAVDVNVAVLPKAVTGAIAITINVSKRICGMIQHGVDLVILRNFFYLFIPDTPFSLLLFVWMTLIFSWLLLLYYLNTQTHSY